MEVKRRTQAERSAASRQALVGSALDLFGQKGFAGVGLTEVAKDAALSRGAVYHQFASKAELFEAVLVHLMQQIATELRSALGDLDARDPLPALFRVADTWLAVCSREEVHRILLVDGPAVLGWSHWRTLGSQKGGGVVVAEVLTLLMDAGSVEHQSVPALTQVLLGALREGAMYASSSQDAAEEAVQALRTLLRSLISPPLGAAK